MGTMKKIPQHTIYNEVSGETQQLYTYEENINDEKYSIRRLKMTVWEKGYTWSMEKTCRSGKDITLFRKLLEKSDRQNLIIFKSAKDFAKENDISRVKLNDFLNRLIKIGFLGKETTNTYRVNPFVVISDKAYITSKTAKSMLQVEWTKNYGYPPESSELEEADNLIGGSNIY